MKILLVHQAFTSPREAGGTRHYELLQYLGRSGHQAAVLASQVSYTTGAMISTRSGFVVREQARFGIEIWRCFTYAALHRSFLHRLLAYWSFSLSSFLAGLQVRDVDLVWGTSPPIFQAITALVLARLKRVPFVFEVRDLWPDFAVDLGVLRQPVLITLSRWLERFLYRSADRIIVNSPGFVPHLRRCGVPVTKVVVVPNGVEPADFEPTNRAGELRRAWGVDRQCVVVYAGAHGMANDLDTLLAAADHVRGEKGISFVLVGDGKEKANLVQRASAMGLSNVLFIPAQPKERMPEVLAAADICVGILKNIPLFTTTYPNKVFDYMAAGRPTVLAIDGVIREVIEQAGGGAFVPPGDASALANAIRRLYRDPALRERQGTNARAHVVTYFARERHSSQLKTTLESIARRPTSVTASYRGKRMLDLAIAIPSLVILSPLMALIALGLRLSTDPPILFRQERPGLHGEPFFLVKFRTMTDACDVNRRLLPDAARLTVVGRFLRSTSLDELPELINVLRGEMSLVGPRPLRMSYLERYTPEQARRHQAKPGITGWAQVNGRNALTWDQKFVLDVWYVEHRSFWLDLKILALTVWKIARRESITQPGRATADEFLGADQ